MFLVYGEGYLVNLDRVDGITVSRYDEGGNEYTYRVRAWNGFDDYVDIVEGCKTEEVALKHIANIANAIQIGKSVYVMGTNPYTDLLPSEYMTTG